MESKRKKTTNLKRGNGAKNMKDIRDQSRTKNTKAVNDHVKTKNTKAVNDHVKTKNAKPVNDHTKTKSAANMKGGCPYAKRCGGCEYQGIPYDQQLKEKENQVRDLLKGICPVLPIVGMEQPMYYRNKVHAVFAYEKGKVYSGIYEEKSHKVVPVEHCMIENEKAQAIIADIRKLAVSFKIKIYDEDTGYGLLRHVLIRTGRTTGEVMVVLVLSSPVMPSKNNFVKALRALHPEITTVIVNVNDRRTSMILGEKETVIYGRGYITDVLCKKTFKISAKSFYQVNPIQTEYLYEKAVALADLHGSETVIDAYCGIGTIGLIASDHAGEVISVELNKDAVRDAVINCKLNQATNVSVYENDAGRFMVKLAESGKTVDVVFMDPPRSGSDEAFLSSVVKLSPQKIVYISCNPETLARDLKYLAHNGYAAIEATPYDQFPYTGHVESVVLITRKDK